MQPRLTRAQLLVTSAAMLVAAAWCVHSSAPSATTELFPHAQARPIEHGPWEDFASSPATPQNSAQEPSRLPSDQGLSIAPTRGPAAKSFSVNRSDQLGNASCESGHWIDEVTSNGAVVILEDGSIWRVSAEDESTTSLWPATTEIVACDGRLINTDDHESVIATRIP